MVRTKSGEGNHDAVWGQHNRERTVTVDDRICSLGQGENVVWLDKKKKRGGGRLGGGEGLWEEVVLRVRRLVSAGSRCPGTNLETVVTPGQEQSQSVRRTRDPSQETSPLPADGSSPLTLSEPLCRYPASLFPVA